MLLRGPPGTARKVGARPEHTRPRPRIRAVKRQTAARPFSRKAVAGAAIAVALIAAVVSVALVLSRNDEPRRSAALDPLPGADPGGDVHGPGIDPTDGTLHAATHYGQFRIPAIAWHERQITGHLEHLADVRDQAGDASERLEAVLEAYALISHESDGHHGAELAAFLHRHEQIARARQQLRDMIRDLLT